jgi:hypothetical protein
VFLLWYPGLVAPASGVRNIFLILLLVDVVLGPVITLIVFNPKKKELQRDLLIVVLIQLAALFYGLHAVFNARPVFMVFNVDRFDIVYATEITDVNLAKATREDYRSFPLFGYRLVAAQSPKDSKQRIEMLDSSLAGGADLPQLPQYYLPYQDMKAEVQKRMRPLDELRSFNKDQLPAIDALINKYALEKNDVGFLPLKAKVSDLTVIVSRNTGEVLGLEDLKPWSW